ncbi:MipA/OmpV family protein [Paracoccus methylarcula]|uniref:MipA/OmpV family protein n=1 Tax=Paracoccus methylarcula TaxID=72022 RepID=A0A3R7Q259_9RHOB|nr:MipA/OmpV family protein [Paracoccus methylarcula]RNF34157.1 MipA/OmpV family protein [Paracoccus methylarcula]
MKRLLAIALLAMPMATVAAAQDFSVDLGIGVTGKPVYPGAEDAEAAPWLIWRNARFGAAGEGDKQGFSVSPSFNMVGERKAEDDAALKDMKDIERAYELGAKVSYGAGPMTAYGSLRKGFEGHSGITGEIGAKYRTDLSDRITLWSGLELGYGDSDYNSTYFGVSPAEAIDSVYGEYKPGGGINSAAIKFQARYAINDRTAILGEVEYGKLIGDAGDSPVVQEEWQPSLRLGVVRRFSFGF